MDLDPRVHPYRTDIAAAHLEGRVESGRFVEGKPCQVKVGTAALQTAPRDDADLASQVLHGDVFTVYENRHGWAWGQARSDHYVGYVHEDELTHALVEPTHRVTAFAAHLYEEADIKRPVRDILPMGSEVAVLRDVGENGKFVELASDGYMIKSHLAPLDETLPDYVATGERLIGIPYLWGGKSTTTGIDCSGLVQIVLALAGRQVLRDSDMQAETLGDALLEAEPLKRGDIVCFPGHIGIMADETILLHANAYHMCVSKDPLSEVIERVTAEQAAHPHPKPAVTCIRRL